jgi:hypothetical protein
VIFKEEDESVDQTYSDYVTLEEFFEEATGVHVEKKSMEEDETVDQTYSPPVVTLEEFFEEAEMLKKVTMIKAHDIKSKI